MDKNSPSMFKATLIGGGVFGILAVIPYVFYLNCFCCALVAGGGFLAAFLYSKHCEREHAAFGPGAGAWVGLVAGLFYTLTTTVISLVRELTMSEADRLDQAVKVDEFFEEFIASLQEANADDAAIEFVEGLWEFVLNVGTGLEIVIGFSTTLLLAAVFSTAGGLIGGSVFKVEPQPPVPTESVPSSDTDGPSNMGQSD